MTAKTKILLCENGINGESVSATALKNNGFIVTTRQKNGNDAITPRYCYSRCRNAGC